MESEKPRATSIALWPELPPTPGRDDGDHPWLDAYPVQTGAPAGAVLICPGGGYGGRAAHEGVTVAERLNREGLHAFVVHYRVAPHRHPAPLRDVAAAIRIIRRRADTWRLRPDRVAVLGFSAGGHLAGSLGVLWNSPCVTADDPRDAITPRPDALVLCYPVITSGEHGHAGSFQNLLGADAPASLRRELSLEHAVGPHTPPTFLWHTGADQGVPVENSLLFAAALRRHGVPFELHVYPDGAHGLGLAEGDPHVASWLPLCAQWLKGQGW